MEDEGRHKREDLKNHKREVMKRDFKKSGERNNILDSFKREFRSLKRSEKNKYKNDIKKEFGV